MAKSKQKKTVLSKSTKKAAAKVRPAAKSVASPRKAAGDGKTNRPAEKTRKVKTAKAPKGVAKSTTTTSRPEIERGRAVPTAVPTNARPRKNQAGLSVKELEYFRGMLLAKRREILGDMSSMEREALSGTSGSNLSNLPVHMADMGTDNYEQEFTLGLVEKDRVLLKEINSALAKIQDGTYGLCEGTGKPISKARLEAKPWARHGIEYARKLESGFGR